MKAYLSFWKNYFNFSARTTARGFWTAYLFIDLKFLCLAVLGLIWGTFWWIVFGLFFIAIIIPLMAMAARRLRDGGENVKDLWFALVPLVVLAVWAGMLFGYIPVKGEILWYNILFASIIIVGKLILLALMCHRSVPTDDTPMV